MLAPSSPPTNMDPAPSPGPLRAGRRHLPMLASDGSFLARVRSHGVAPPTRGPARTLQVNLGKLCNMACLHCHVEAGPARTEVMSRDVAERVIELLRKNPQITVLDLTGGAPELNPNFRWLVVEARRLGRRVIDRSNLTVLFEPHQEELPEFLASQQVEIVASLPCYGPENVEKQRGRGVFAKSIRALQVLNALGYGRPGAPLKLSLVYNPVGASLPPEQATLEARYKQELEGSFGVVFNDLLTITNMPISRFAHALERDGKLEEYMTLLVHSFNPSTLPELMCRSLVSVGWDGRLFDCDFNQMLELPLGAGARTIWDVDSLVDLTDAPVATASHCFGCTAGHGSSCGGALQP